MEWQTSLCSSSGDPIFYLYYRGKCNNFPDARVAIDDMVVGGDEVAFRITIKGTENGKASGEETYFARFKGGKAPEHAYLNRRLE